MHYKCDDGDEQKATVGDGAPQSHEFPWPTEVKGDKTLHPHSVVDSVPTGARAAQRQSHPSWPVAPIVNLFHFTTTFLAVSTLLSGGVGEE